MKIICIVDIGFYFPALPSADLYDANQELVPLVVRQHFEPPRKYVVLTSQGVHILLKLRPVDILKQFLLDGRGADSEAVKNFFMVETEDQACATSLILASLESHTNAELAEAATRAFFIFGGEPKLSGCTTYNQTQLRSTFFQPNVISTPAPHHLTENKFQTNNLSLTQNLPFDASSIFQFSSKHNGLYLYFGRILRPVWGRKCVHQVSVDPKSKVFAYSSTINVENVTLILNNLMALHNFLLINTQLCVCGPTQNQNISINNSMIRSSYTIQDAQLEER